ncbi:tetratricopeptide repeat protein [Mucisphaera calidilacus]|uniref:Tetratricopeptide repeat protein n=1 Tax=Mucisphaera calidilacus TaxID=2527982 RepID=A0A518BUJ4_9BACT|nr:tetratricopeptide repeat protein [Mucisphaera calidilacus]QDU70604.1 Tetratricopeptide repeat protein [Mucisphaera calidilacus]
MISRLALLSLICLGTAGCAALNARNAAAEEEPIVATAPAEGDTRGADLSIWDDSRFKDQFTDSYVADTEIEPRVTTIERDVMLSVIELLREAGDLEGEARLTKQAEAIEVIEEENSETGTAVFDFTLGNIYFEQEKLPEAEVAYREAIEKHRKFRRAWRSLGMLYIRQSNWEQAIEAMTKVIELGGGDGITYGLMGFAYSSINNPLSAESAYRQAILLEPGRLDWKMGLVRSFFRQQRFADVVALSNEMIEKDTSNADLWLLQANAYLQLNQPMDAAENYEFVDRLGKSTPETLNMLGDIYLNQEFYDLAVASYIRSLEHEEAKDPSRAVQAARVLTARAELELTAQLVAVIKANFEEELSVDDRKAILRMEARFALAEGATDREAEIIREIVELDPLDGEALILLGQHEASKVRDQQAAVQAVKASDNPDPADVEAADAALAEQVAKAVFYFERAAAIEGFEADASVRQAQLMVRLGQYEKALPLLRRAQQIKPRENVQQYLQQVERIARSG